MCDVHVESNDSAIIAWHGRTYEFRAAFNVMGIPLAEESNRFCLLPEEYKLLCQQENVEFVNGIFGANVLKDAFVNLRITDEAIAADGNAVARFFADLKTWRNIFADAH